MISAVPRTAGGVRNYGDAEWGWGGLAICMRSAGVSGGYKVLDRGEIIKIFEDSLGD